MSGVGLILLAAGASTRLGAPKQLLAFQGKSLLRHAAATALESRCRPVVIVLGAEAERLRAEVAGLNAQVIVHAQWAEGMGTSLRAGMEAITLADSSLDAVVVMLCDQPLVSSGLLNRLIAAHRESRAPLVACAYAATVGVPALFAKSLFPELLRSQGNVGAKRVLQMHADSIFSISFPEGAIDIDTADDWERWLASPPG